MAFPQTILDSRAHLFHGGTWNAITGDVRGMGSPNGRVRITRGRSDEAGQTRATTCGLALTDPTGRYNPRNPNSNLFGLIGRNTPLRVSIGEPHVGAADSDTTAATSHVAPSVTAAKAGLLVCAWYGALASEAYTLPAGMTAGPSTANTGRQRMASAREAVSAGATGTRTATVTTARPWVAASVLLHGTSITVQETLSAFGLDDDLTVTTATGTQAGWWLVAVQGWGLLPQERARFMPDAPNDDTGGWVLLADSDVNRAASFNHQQVRMWARRVNVAGAQAVTFFGNHPPDSLDNNDHHAHLYVLSGVDNWQPRAHVEIPAWPQRWDVSGRDVFVPLEAAGPLRRLGQGQDPLQSPIRRTVTGDLMASLDPGPGVGTLVPVAYWPLEDGRDSSRAASGLAGGQPMRQSGGTFTFATVDGPGGSAPLPDMLASTGNLRGPVAGLTATSEWVASFVVQFTGTNTWTALELLLAGGPYPRLELRLSTTVALFGVDDAGTATSEGSLAVDMSDGRWYWCELRGTVSGGTVSWALRVRAEDGQFLAGALDGFTALGDATGTATGPITGVLVHARAAGTAASLGHVMVWPRSEDDPRNLVLVAFDGYLSETAGRRLERLCGEEMIVFHPVGGLDVTAAMGPQSPGTLLEVLRECEAADLGILYEPREALGLAYRTRRSLYNQAATLALTYGATGEVAPPLEPTPDDFALRNDVTVTRAHGAITGGSARAVRDTGPLAVATVGRYPDDPRINVASDDALPDQAGWRLHLGTVDEDRFPGVRVNLASLGAAAKQTLADAAAALDLGDRLSIASPPAWLPPETISQVAVGASEVLAQFEWDLVLNTAPESPLRIAEVAHATQSILGSDSATLSAGLTTTGTSAAINCGAGPDWVREVNFDIMIGGERMTVTAVAAMAGTFPNRTTTLTVTRSVNGVVKTHATGAGVAMFPLVYIGL